MKRRDGRMEYELRPMAAEFSSLASCDGSARLRCGETDVIVGVQGPRPPRAVRFEDATGCLIEVMLQPAYGQMGSKEKEMEGLVRDAVDAVVAKSAIPRTVLTIIVQVLHDGGSLLATIVNCCSLALVDAGVPLTGTLAAVQAVGRVVASNDVADKGEGEGEAVSLLLDPTKEEEKTDERGRSAAEKKNIPAAQRQPRRLTQIAAWRGDDHFVSLLFRSVADGAEKAEGRGAASSTSSPTPDPLLLLRNACATVLAFQRLALAKKVERDSVCFVGESAVIGLATAATTTTTTTSRVGWAGGAR